MVFGMPDRFYTPSKWFDYRWKVKVEVPKPYLRQVYDSWVDDGIIKVGPGKSDGYGQWCASAEGREVLKNYNYFLLKGRI